MPVTLNYWKNRRKIPYFYRKGFSSAFTGRVFEDTSIHFVQRSLNALFEQKETILQQQLNE